MSGELPAELAEQIRADQADPSGMVETSARRPPTVANADPVKATVPAPQQVAIPVAPQMLERLAVGWSEPVQVMLAEDDGSSTGYMLTLRAAEAVTAEDVRFLLGLLDVTGVVASLDGPDFARVRAIAAKVASGP